MKRALLSLLLLTTACSNTVRNVTYDEGAPDAALTGPQIGMPSHDDCDAAWCVRLVLPKPGHDMESVWADTPNDVFAVDSFGAIYRFDGNTWQSLQATGMGYMGVWGTGPTDVWAAGDDLQHWDGTTWTNFPSPSRFTMAAVWGLGSNDVYAAGGGGDIVHWDGATWSFSASGADHGDLPWDAVFTRLWGSSPKDVWGASQIGVSHWNGTKWSQPANVGKQIAEAVWGSSSSDVWVVGQYGMIAHFDGTQWSEIPSGTQLGLVAIWGSAADDVWAVGEKGTIVHWDGSSWSLSPSGVTQHLFGIHGTSAHDVWAVGMNVIVHHS